MFGDSMFEGGDENATALGGDTSGSGLGSTSPMAYGGQADQFGSQVGAAVGGAMGNANVDPAMTAFASSEAGAEQSVAQNATLGSNTAAGINSNPAGGGGQGQMVGAIFNLVDPHARRLARRQRSMARTQSRLMIANAQRAIAQFQMDSQREGQALQQSYSGRGVGQSSIEQEGMDYFRQKTALESDRLNDNLNLARVGMALTNSQIAASYATPYLQLVAGMGNTVSSML